MLVLSSKLKFSSFIFHQHMPNWLLDNKILFYNYLLNLNLLPPFILPYLHENTESVSHSVVSNCVTPQTVAHQASLSMGFSRQEYWRGLPFPSPGNLSDPQNKPRPPALQTNSLASQPPGKPSSMEHTVNFIPTWSMLYVKLSPVPDPRGCVLMDLTQSHHGNMKHISK